MFLRKATRMRSGVYILLCILAILPFNLSAQLIGLWNFTNTAVGIPALNNSTSNVTFSPSIGSAAFNGGGEYYGEGGWPTGALNTSAYVQFSLSPSSGFNLNLLAVIFRMRRSNTGSPSGSGPTAWSLRSSLDGYSTNIASGTLTHNYSTFTVLPGLPFLSLPLGVTFRIYGYASNISSGGISRLVFDFIQVTGLGAVLPVNIASFTAQKAGEHASLNYSLRSTVPGSVYSIERSIDGTNFSSIYSSTETQSLDQVSRQFIDPTPLAANAIRYYRLHVIDPGGGSIYSGVALVSNRAGSNRVNMYLNNNKLLVTGNLEHPHQVRMFSYAGALVFQQTINTLWTGQTASFELPSLTPGVYIVSIESGREKYVEKLLLR